MNREAQPDHPVHELITKRWSPYAFADRDVAPDDLRCLLEAARWAPSSYNEQPWTYFIATRHESDQYEKIFSCLVEGNQAWAKAAPVLMLCCTKLTFNRNDKPNAAAIHDLGLAAGNLCLEATARGISVHQMIGILPDKAREVFSIPDDVEAKTAMAIGYATTPEDLPDELKKRDTAPRTRKPLSDFIFTDTWGQTSPLVKE